MTAFHQIVATVGPSSWSLVRALREAGATAFRLNASHLDANALHARLSAISGDAADAEIVVDLQGAKMRLGRMPALDVTAGQEVVFSLDGRAGLPLPHPELFGQAGPGDTMSVDDGRVRLTVLASDGERLRARASESGRLQERKGVNLVEHPVVLAGLTPGDRAAFDAARSLGVRTFAFSFMRDGSEARWLKALDEGCRVVGKVERREAAGQVDALAARVDAVWICRGDLGVQLGPAGLARFVATADPTRLAAPVLMAGQVLEHLTAHPEPTRSEVCHLYDLAARGYAGIVLSDETAIGADPVRAVRAAAALVAAFERL